MKTIKIFLASSLRELEYDRNAFGNFIRRLNKVFRKREVELDLFECEDDDSSLNDIPKQEEYDEEVRSSDCFVAIFFKTFGEWTLHEMSIAVDHAKKQGTPKTFIYLKDTERSDAPELVNHHVQRYHTYDELQLGLVIQLLSLDEHLQSLHLKVIHSSIVVDNCTVAELNNLSFVKQNARYTSLCQTEDTTINREKRIEYLNYLLKLAIRLGEISSDCYSSQIEDAQRLFLEGKAEQAEQLLDKTTES